MRRVRRLIHVCLEFVDLKERETVGLYGTGLRETLGLLSALEALPKASKN